MILRPLYYLGVANKGVFLCIPIIPLLNGGGPPRLYSMIHRAQSQSSVIMVMVVSRQRSLRESRKQKNHANELTAGEMSRNVLLDGEVRLE